MFYLVSHLRSLGERWHNNEINKLLLKCSRSTDVSGVLVVTHQRMQGFLYNLRETIAFIVYSYILGLLDSIRNVFLASRIADKILENSIPMEKISLL